MFGLLSRLFQKRPVIGTPEEAIAKLKFAAQQLHETVGVHVLHLRPTEPLTVEERRALKAARQAIKAVAAHGYTVRLRTFGSPKLEPRVSALWLEHRLTGISEAIFADSEVAVDWLRDRLTLQNRYAQAA